MDKQAVLTRKRKERDIAKLMQKNYKIEKQETNSDTFEIAFDGPKGTPYEGGSWKIRVYLPEGYPYKSPSIGFINKIFHPNVDFQCA